jgi:hypothetical protein
MFGSISFGYHTSIFQKLLYPYTFMPKQHPITEISDQIRFLQMKPFRLKNARLEVQKRVLEYIDVRNCPLLTNILERLSNLVKHDPSWSSNTRAMWEYLVPRHMHKCTLWDKVASLSKNK